MRCPLRSYPREVIKKKNRDPKGEDRLPVASFFRGKLLHFRCVYIYISFIYI